MMRSSSCPAAPRTARRAGLRRPRALADEADIGVEPPHAEHRLRPGGGQAGEARTLQPRAAPGRRGLPSAARRSAPQFQGRRVVEGCRPGSGRFRYDRRLVGAEVSGVATEAIAATGAGGNGLVGSHSMPAARRLSRCCAALRWTCSEFRAVVSGMGSAPADRRGAVPRQVISGLLE